MKMQHFDMESTVYERGGSHLYISVRKSFSTFLTFSPILAYISLSVIDNMVPFYADTLIWSIFELRFLGFQYLFLVGKMIGTYNNV